MKFAYSFRVKLTILYLLTILVPMLIVVIVMPYYFEQIIIRNAMNETDQAIEFLQREVETNLRELEKLTLVPYSNDEVMRALKQKSQAHPLSDPYQLLLSNRALESTLQAYMKIARDDIVATSIMANDNRMYAKTVNSTDPVPDFPFLQENWYQAALKGDGKAVFIGPHQEEYLRNPPAPEVFSVSRVIKDPDTQENLAIIMADADTQVIHRIVDGIKLNALVGITIFNEQYQPLYRSTNLPPLSLASIHEGHSDMRLSDDTYIIIRKNFSISNWGIVAVISKSAIQSQFQWVYLVGVLFGLGGLALTVILFFSLSHWVINPFKKMVAMMQKVQRGHFDVQVQIKGRDEIAQLGAAFNSMVRHLNETIDREFRAELNARNAEFRSLQAQLQPHFIYNVLNGFIGLNRMGHKEALEQAIVKLSRMLRYVLLKQDQMSLKDEFQFLHHYCGLQKMRFMNKGFEYHIHCDTEIEQMVFPKLLLQPLVENSIIHGIEPINRKCALTISARRIATDGAPYLEIVVEDSGAGFDLSAIDPKRHIGIENVRERLKLAFRRSCFEMNSTVGHGTRTVITIEPDDKERTI